MANHGSALKRMRQSEKRAFMNRSRLSRVRTFIKKFISGLESDGAAAVSAFSKAQSEIQKCAGKAMHRNTANRKISRLSRLLKSSEAKR
jgi:small subunit ribosomal protein S20